MSKPATERTKVVIRNLPPTLTADAFTATINKHVQGTYDWMAYYPGKVSLKRTAFSRAFINFSTAEAVFAFKGKFDGHVFVSTRGTQYRCSVEYAPFQKVPATNQKRLAMEGTIDKDPDYQTFVKALEEGPKSLPTAQAQLEAQEAASAADEATGPVITPLMAFLQKKYESTPFTGKRSSKASRRKEIPRLTPVDEARAVVKPVKGRRKLGRSSDAAMDVDASTAAAAAGAAEHALKGTRQKPVKPGRSQQQAQQPESEILTAAKGKQPGDKAAATPASPATTSPGKRLKPRGSAAGAALEASAASISSRSGHNKPAATASAAAAPDVKATAEDDDGAKRAVAAALAAANAANAAAAAARKSRVRAGHQVYTPRAGGRLFAAALPKGAAAADVAAAMSVSKPAADTPAAPAATSITSARPPDACNITPPPAAPADATRKQQKQSSASSTWKGPARGPGNSGTPTARVSNAQPANSSSASTTSTSTACPGASAIVNKVSAADSSAAQTGESSMNRPPSSSSRGGRGRGAGGRQPKQLHNHQQQQQQWVPKAAGSG
eukprot:GHRR01006004.1.p1 GENE.GHRR01006004.1~~GHRR01006004.1.p1  ORF type:complete len:554 (+),score=244.95 GHRR01006004.1:250-1911(+)